MLSNGQQIGKYKILSAIGAGGMGEVFLAIDTRLDRQVTIKILPADVAQNPDRLRRFALEAKAASALNHPNVITIHEIGETDSTLFIVTEYIEGKTLRAHIKQNSFALGNVLDIGIQIASALQTVHTVNIVHRDIKPENIMIRPDGLVKILDFGIAKLVEKRFESIDSDATTEIEQQTAEGMIIGTAAYMSPEQAQGKEVDARSDIFSFGVVLYETVSGQQPFAGENTIDIIVKILHQEPTALNKLIPEIHPALERIINKTLRKDRNERYQSTKDLLVDLKTLQRLIESETKTELLPTQLAEINAETLVYIAETNKEDLEFPPNNLTENPLPIVGREKEIAEIKNLLLQKNTRLTTLTGIGGTGKSTLAQAVARELLTEFSDGVFFIELADISNHELVVSTIAHPIGVKEGEGTTILEMLKDYLRDKQMLLVVDNFEQVMAAAPQISELLSATNRLKILITSRELLQLRTEQEYIVPPLVVPSNVDSIPLEELSSYEAIKLFVERAQNAKADFVLTNENAQYVAKICARLEGLPLAIELAAARVKILTPQAILIKLENGLKILTGGSKDLPVRQQTMRGAVGWSYELLSEDEKQFFRRLSVFASGFTLEGAEAVCFSNETDETQVELLDLVTSLVDKSLLVSKEQSSGETRFRMLEIVREYALESLEASGEAEEIRHKHADYFLHLGQKAAWHFQGAESAEWFNRLEEEHNNIRAALRWSLENDVNIATRLAGAVWHFWSVRGHLMEGGDWLKAALVRGSSNIPKAVRFKLLNALGWLELLQGDYKMAWKTHKEALAESAAANDLRQIGMSKSALAAVASRQGDFTTAQKFIEEGMENSRKLDDKSGIYFWLMMLGDIARIQNDNTAARPLFEEALQIIRQQSNKDGVSSNLNNLGAVMFELGDFKAARSYFAESLAIAKELRNKINISYNLDGFAALATKDRQLERAARLAGLAEYLRESIGYEIEPAERRFLNTYLTELKTEMDEAAFTKAYEEGQKLKLEEAIALCL
jgi:non-specific serine/threonine protein kinase